MLGEIDIAIVAASNLILDEDMFRSIDDVGMLSSDGCCRAFDCDANGFVRGEAIVALVLKREHDATGDHVFASIAGSSVNSDGTSHGLMAPNLSSQVELYRRALANASKQAEHVSMIECHGTGTVLGDAVELASIAEVYPAVLLHSSKPLVGHGEASAGMTAIIQLVMSMQTNVLPCQLHLQLFSSSGRYSLPFINQHCLADEHMTGSNISIRFQWD